MSGAQAVLVVLLGINAAVVFGYRVYRLTRGGPTADAIGGALLAGILAVVAAGAGADAAWARWAALLYAFLFAILVMPVWTLGVLIPLSPGPLDYAFTAVYWISLLLIGVMAILA